MQKSNKVTVTSYFLNGVTVTGTSYFFVKGTGKVTSYFFVVTSKALLKTVFGGVVFIVRPPT